MKIILTAAALVIAAGGASAQCLKGGDTGWHQPLKATNGALVHVVEVNGREYSAYKERSAAVFAFSHQRMDHKWKRLIFSARRENGETFYIAVTQSPECKAGQPLIG